MSPVALHERRAGATLSAGILDAAVVAAGSALFGGGELTANARLLLTATGSARNDGSPDLDGPRDQGGE